ncbi:hypothetical protein ACFSQ7_48110 [Paenibacillus rhizoplanae]
MLDERITLSGKKLPGKQPVHYGTIRYDSSLYQSAAVLASSKKSNVKNYKPFTLGMAAGPADSKDRKSTGYVFGSEILAIPAGASNVDAAWEFIKYFNGDDHANEYYKPNNSNNSIGCASVPHG